MPTRPLADRLMGADPQQALELAEAMADASNDENRFDHTARLRPDLRHCGSQRRRYGLRRGDAR